MTKRNDSSHTRTQQPARRASSGGGHAAPRNAAPRGGAPRGAKPAGAQRGEGGGNARAPKGSKAPRNSTQQAFRKKKSMQAQRTIALVVVVAVILVGVFFGLRSLFSLHKVQINLNDEMYTLESDTTYVDLIDAGYVTPRNGDLIDVEGNVIAIGGGELFTATCDDEEVPRLNKRIKNKTVVKFIDGEDVYEPSDEENTVEPYKLRIIGNSASGDLGVVMDEGQDGTSITRTGHITHKTFTQVVTEPVNQTIFYYYPGDTMPGTSKSICLLFTGGPTRVTQDLIDLLQSYNIKATFCLRGEYAEANENIVAKIVEAGMDVIPSSLSFGGNFGSFGNLTKLSDEQAYEDMIKGIEAYEAATGKDAQAFYAPGGNFNVNMWSYMHNDMSVDVHWSIDSGDSFIEDPEEIAKYILDGAFDGSIILCHDDSECYKNLEAALKIALPKLIEDGWGFLTVSELVEQSKPVAEIPDDKVKTTIVDQVTFGTADEAAAAKEAEKAAAEQEKADKKAERKAKKADKKNKD